MSRKKQASKLAPNDLGLFALALLPTDPGDFLELLRDELDKKYCTSPELGIALRKEENKNETTQI